MLEKDSLQAYGAFVLIERLPVDKKTKTGLDLPENQMSKNLRCKVLSVGAGEWVNETHIHSGLVPGDVVSVRQYDGRQINIDKSVRLVHMEMIENKSVDKPWPINSERI